MQKKKSLVLLTDFFPFGIYEPYLKHEMIYLPEYFEEIFLLATVSKTKESLYELSPNVTAGHLNNSLNSADKFLGLRFLFNKIFWSELRIVRRQYNTRLSVALIKIILSYLQIASKLKNQIAHFIDKHKLKEEDLILYSFWNDARAMAISQIARKKKSVAISRAHGWDVYFDRHQPPYLPFRQYLMNHLSGCFFVSEDGRNYTLRQLGSSIDHRYRVSLLGTQYFGRNPEKNEGELIIVSCSRFVPLKRNYLIAEILQYLNFPVRWIHFGGGEALERESIHIKEILSNHDNVAVELRGDIANEELFNFYFQQHVDLFILTSEYEGMPMVIMEALSFGIPVMATDVGGIREMICEKNGFLIPKDFDKKEAANKISNFRSLNEYEKRKYRSAAFERWKEKFDASKNYPAFAEELVSISESAAQD